jgi:hypothetical protein
MNTHTIKSNHGSMLVNTMKAHTCNTKRSQKTFEPRANKPNLSHTSRNVTHTIRISHTQVEMSHTKKSNFLRGVFGKLASMLIYLGRKNLHIFPHFVYGGRIECCKFPRFNYKALFWFTCLAWIRILYIAYNSMEEDNLHVTEDRLQSLVRGIVWWTICPR